MQRKNEITFLFRLLQQQLLLLLLLVVVVFWFVCIQLRKDESVCVVWCGNHNSLQNKIYIGLSLCACMSNSQANHLSNRKREYVQLLVVFLSLSLELKKVTLRVKICIRFFFFFFFSSFYIIGGKHLFR
jgi:energy-coupling factor transporter transmembrane protein EcfT